MNNCDRRSLTWSLTNHLLVQWDQPLCIPEVLWCFSSISVLHINNNWLPWPSHLPECTWVPLYEWLHHTWESRSFLVIAFLFKKAGLYLQRNTGEKLHLFTPRRYNKWNKSVSLKYVYKSYPTCFLWTPSVLHNTHQCTNTGLVENLLRSSSPWLLSFSVTR